MPLVLDQERRVRQVLVVDDHELFRSGLRLLLETSLGCHVHEAADGDEAVALAETHLFDIAFLDMCMPDRDGLWTLRQLRLADPSIPVVMLSAFAERDSVRACLDAGASGYLVKGAEIAQVHQSIKAAVGGEGIYLHPIAAQMIVQTRNVGFGERLTARESEVLELVVGGATNEDIASKLCVTEKTVKTHLTSVFRKLGVTNRTQAATKALREGLVPEPPSQTKV